MDTKRISLFLFFAFSICWLFAGLFKLTGLPYGGMVSMAFIALGCMMAPAASVFIVTKLIYKEKLWGRYGLKTKNFKIKGLIWAVVFPLIFVYGTILTCYLIGNVMGFDSFGFVDISESAFQEKLSSMFDELVSSGTIPDQEYPDNLPIPPWLFLIGIPFSALISALSINLPFMFGEELGWRGLLLDETRIMGFWGSNLFIGIVWGLWHAPLILMGHNYPEYPIAGVLMMVAFCVLLSFPFAYVRLKNNNILAPSVFHGMVNGMAAVVAFFVFNGHPLVASIVGIAGFIVCLFLILLIVILDKSFIKNYGSFF